MREAGRNDRAATLIARVDDKRGPRPLLATSRTRKLYALLYKKATSKISSIARSSSSQLQNKTEPRQAAGRAVFLPVVQRLPKENRCIEARFVRLKSRAVTNVACRLQKLAESTRPHNSYAGNV